MAKKHMAITWIIITLALAIFINAETVGNYFIKPSFKIDFNYNPLEDYNLVTQEMQSLVTECSNKPDRTACINQRIVSFNLINNHLELYLGSCDKGAKKIFYEFIENYDSCASSSDTDCICDFSLAFNDPSLKQDYKLKLSKNQEITLEKPEGFVYSLTNIPSYIGNTPSNIEQRDYVDYFIEYNQDGSFKKATLGLESFGLDAKWDYPNIQLYKTTDNKIAFVKETDGKRQCASTKNIFKFCAINKNQQFYVYDPAIDQQKPTLQNPTIKFALYMEDFPPPTITNLIIQDKQESDKSIIASWDKSIAPDIKTYSIYKSKENFWDWKIENHKATNQDKEVIPTNLDLKQVIELKNIDFNPECDFDTTTNTCNFLFSVTKQDNNQDKIELEPNQIYYIEDEDRYFTILESKTDEKYNIAVTAVDIAGNEINNIDEKRKLTQGENYNQGHALDDLPPGIVGLNEPTIKTKDNKQVIELTYAPPSKNIDGTLLKDSIKEYNIYYEKAQFDSLEQLTKKATTKEIIYDIDITSLEKNTIYYIAVTAIDNSDNEFKEKAIIKTITLPG